MTDIVERLRNRNNPENRRVMMTEAADEIERLREHVAALQLVATAHEPEIERLRAACELFTKGAHDAVKALNAAGIACPASIALAAEKARRALEPKP